MRGDYLAIVTLGFGEIVRLLALSDWLRPWFGGSQGIQLIAQPRIGSFVLNTQQELYYLFLIGVGIVGIYRLPFEGFAHWAHLDGDREKTRM